LIVGVDKDDPEESNGVGKTAIFYAIEYALFGTVPSDTIDEIVRDDQKSCRVVFEFKTKDSEYKIERIRKIRSKKSYLELFEKVGDKWEKRSAKTPTETGAELAKIIKINRESFRNSVLFLQSDLKGLASESSEKRRAILREALGLDIYRKFEKLTKDKITKLNKKIDPVLSAISNLGYPGDNIKRYKKELKLLKSDITTFIKAIDQRESKLKEKREELTRLQRLISSDDDAVHNRLSDTKSSIIETKNSISSNVRKVDNTKRDLVAIEGAIAVKKDDLKSAEDKLISLKDNDLRSVEEAKADLEKMSKNEINGIAYIRSIETKADGFRQPFPDRDTCPHCRQKVTKEHREECLKQINKDLEKLEVEIKTNKTKLSACRSRKAQLVNEISEISVHSDRIYRLSNSIEVMRSKIDGDESHYDLVKSNIPALESAKNELENKLSALQYRESSLLDTIKKSSDDELNDKILNLKKNIRSDESEISSDRLRVSDLNIRIGACNEKMRSAIEDSKRLKDEKKKLSVLHKKLKTLQVVARGFSPAGIPAMIILTILDDLQIETNRFLNDLRPGLETQFAISKEKDDGESEEVLDVAFVVHGRKRSYKLLSGGQKFLFAVSLKLGLSLIIQKRLGIDIRFLELDEVDQALDKSAVKAYADVIRKLQKHFKIFVITHNDSLKDRFSHAILVEGDSENGAVSKLVTSW
jgi:exonuclease SbcC